MARALSQLGLVCYLGGDDAGAEQAYLRSLEIGEKAAMDAAKIGTALNNLATLYFRQERLEDAEGTYRRDLELRLEALGPAHPNYVFSLSQLAMFYRRQDRLGDAAELYRSSIASQEQALGPDHPALAASATNLGVIHRLQDLHRSAEPHFRRALEIVEKNPEASPSDLAASVNNLAVLYADLGRWAEAEQFYQRALTISDKTFGSDHASVALGMMNLASLYLRQDDRDRAVASIARAEPILRSRCAGQGEGSSGQRQICRNALLLHRQLAGRLEAASPGTEIASKTEVEGSAAEEATTADARPSSTPPAPLPPPPAQSLPVQSPPAEPVVPATDSARAAALRVHRAQLASRRELDVAERTGHLDRSRLPLTEPTRRCSVGFPSTAGSAGSRAAGARYFAVGGNRIAWHRICFPDRKEGVGPASLPIWSAHHGTEKSAGRRR